MKALPLGQEGEGHTAGRRGPPRLVMGPSGLPVGGPAPDGAAGPVTGMGLQLLEAPVRPGSFWPDSTPGKQAPATTGTVITASLVGGC